MQATRRAAERHSGQEYPDEGLHAWVVLVCLAFVAVTCFVVLRFTINMLSAQPPVQPAPATGPPGR